jgi:hypothetical protein
MATKKKAKKVAKKVGPRKTAAKAVAVAKPVKPIGVVTHFYTAIKVAIIKFKQPVKAGTTVAIRGTTTDFNQKIASMQFDHKALSVAPKNKEVGVKVSKRVREGDQIFSV